MANEPTAAQRADARRLLCTCDTHPKSSSSLTHATHCPAFDRDVGERVSALIAERDEARANAAEQARLNGMGSEREARLQTQLAEAQRRVEESRETIAQYGQRITELLDVAQKNGDRIARLEEALRDIAIWTQELQDRMDSRDLAIAQWRGCVAIARAALADTTEGGGDAP